MYLQSKRNYTNIETGEIFAMFHNAETGQNKLVNLKTDKEIINFYCAGHSSMTLRLKNKKEILLNMGDFLEITKDNNPTHIKYLWNNRFVKL
jgi:hypothetical protein